MGTEDCTLVVGPGANILGAWRCMGMGDMDLFYSAQKLVCKGR